MEVNNGLDLFLRAVRLAGERPAVHYFGRDVGYAELDRESNALAFWLVAQGMNRGDRVATYMQNIPQFLTVFLAAWKAGGIVVPINPMNKAAELAVILNDAEPVAIVMEPDLYAHYLALTAEAHRPDIVLTASPLHGLSPPFPSVLGGVRHETCEGVEDMDRIVATSPDEAFPYVAPKHTDPAAIAYTSGTTGKPKGAIISHFGLAAEGSIAQDAASVPDFGIMIAIAPVFHITGLVCNLMCGFHAAGPQVLVYRFDAATVLAAVGRYRPVSTVGTITSYIALMNDPGVTAESLSSLKTALCGGGPVPIDVVAKFRERTGITLRNGYGMTEVCGIAVMAPAGLEPRVDEESGSLSVGTPVDGFAMRIVDDAGDQLPSGSPGEVILDSPVISPGYWRDGAATAASRHQYGFRTGDIGKIDDDGWLYIVDRKKDMIVAGGFKVWPREVEEVLYSHPAVREAAVIGVADAYRGETVKAVVSLRAGHETTEADIIAFCKERMAAYKYPRLVQVVADLPKTETGKILRRLLR